MDSDSVEDKKSKKSKDRRPDPEKMTIQEIKSALTHAGKDNVLPTEKRPKSEYIRLYMKYMKE